jgi:peptide/nickel transport system ATP-binding protein
MPAERRASAPLPSRVLRRSAAADFHRPGAGVTNPDFVVADESVAALDVSIQADILNLLKQLQRDLNLTFLFISHDLSVVAHTCDYVAVMYLGRIVETAPPRRLFSSPRHPYTRALISAIPSLDPDDRGRAERLEGEIPSPANPPSGCAFHTRCPMARDRCRAEVPELRAMADGHQSACHFAEEMAVTGTATRSLTNQTVPG